MPENQNGTVKFKKNLFVSILIKQDHKNGIKLFILKLG